MKTYEVLLTKSYVVKIKAEDKYHAKEFSQVFTSDIANISHLKEEKEIFEIEDIDCTSNKVFGIEEINEEN